MLKISEKDLIKALRELSPNGFKLWTFNFIAENNKLKETKLYYELLEDEEDYIYAFEELEYKGYLTKGA